MKVDTADDGIHAIEMCKNGSYDLILMDFQMPNMNGIDATRALIQMGVLTPIVGLTANADEMSRNEAMKAGMKRLMMKPIRGAELREVVDSTAMRR